MPGEPKKTPLTEHLALAFSQLQVKKQLLQELGEEMAIIMSSIDNLEIQKVHLGAASPSSICCHYVYFTSAYHLQENWRQCMT